MMDFDSRFPPRVSEFDHGARTGILNTLLRPASSQAL